MLTTALALAMLSGIALFLMTSDERARLRQIVLAAARRALEEARRPSPGGPFDDFLRSRTGRPVVTPALGALCALLFLLMVFAPGAVDDLETLVSWGGNIAPRATGGEWWRLVTAMFIHAGPLHLLATIAGLVPLGLILERT